MRRSIDNQFTTSINYQKCKQWRLRNLKSAGMPKENRKIKYWLIIKKDKKDGEDTVDTRYGKCFSYASVRNSFLKMRKIVRLKRWETLKSQIHSMTFHQSIKLVQDSTWTVLLHCLCPSEHETNLCRMDSKQPENLKAQFMDDFKIILNQFRDKTAINVVEGLWNFEFKGNFTFKNLLECFLLQWYHSINYLEKGKPLLSINNKSMRSKILEMAFDGVSSC